MSAGANNHTSAPTNSEDQFVTSILRRQCQDFRRLAILKDRYTLREGNVEITEHDTSNETLQLLGEEMHEKCRVFSLPENPEVLDLCRVPSGFASTILKENPEARVSAVTIYRKTIHRKEGGDEIVVVAQMSDSRAKVFFKDITMLANEIGIFDVTEFDRNGVPLKDIYDASRKHFDLIICNGGSLDGETEAMGRRRGQLILAMSRIKVCVLSYLVPSSVTPCYSWTIVLAKSMKGRSVLFADSNACDRVVEP